LTLSIIEIDDAVSLEAGISLIFKPELHQNHVNNI